jgi:hypothetical protein
MKMEAKLDNRPRRVREVVSYSERQAEPKILKTQNNYTHLFQETITVIHLLAL